MSNLSLSPSSSQDVYIKDGWFSETEAMWPGQKFCIQVEEVLVNGRSKFQDILLFKSKAYGTVLVLDGVIQVTERDEFAYQEMIAHLPIFACSSSAPGPKKVLIVGGGDGGVLREVVKHSSVEEIHMCEIDDQVIEVSKKYYSDSLATAFGDPRLTLMIDDAAKYLREQGAGQNYDVIICDSSDPVGPADVLFQPAFFESMKNALNPATGVICTQGECQWLHLDLIERVIGDVRSLMPNVRYAFTTIPTYPSGQIGFIIASMDASTDLAEPMQTCPEEVAAGFKYYSPEVHRSAFVLPAFAARRLYPKKS
mmetsp:Transcript_12173/g.20350  ORF Transcript_12173/g.20350 Transcript_12173/m.20350 type:complete len:310 (+) Transcript_12173:72-1001(+)